MARGTRLYAALTAPTRPFGMASRQAGRTVSSLAPALMPMWDKYMDNPENQKAFGELGKSAGTGLAGMIGGGGSETLKSLLPGLMERAGPMLGRMAPRVGAAVGSDLLAQGGDMLGAPQEEWDPSIRRQNMMMAMQLPPEMNVPEEPWAQWDGGASGQPYADPPLPDSSPGGISQDFQARPMEALDPRLAGALHEGPGSSSSSYTPGAPPSADPMEDFQARPMEALDPRLAGALHEGPGSSSSSYTPGAPPSADPVEAVLGKGSWGKMASGAVGVIPGVGGVAGPVIEGVYDKLHAPVASVDPLARARQGVMNLSGALDNATSMAGSAVKEMQGNSAPRFSPGQAASAPPPRMSAPPSLGSLLAGQRKSVPAPGPDRVAMAAAADAAKSKREDDAAQSSADQAFNHYLLPEARVYPPRGGSPPTLRDDSMRLRPPPGVKPEMAEDNWQQRGPYDWQFNKGKNRLSGALKRTWM